MNRTRTSGVNHTTVSSGPAVGIERCIPLRLFQTQPHTDSWPGCSPARAGTTRLDSKNQVELVWSDPTSASNENSSQVSLLTVVIRASKAYEMPTGKSTWDQRLTIPRYLCHLVRTPGGTLAARSTNLRAPRAVTGIVQAGGIGWSQNSSTPS